MASLRRHTVKLQGRSTDILEAHSIVSEVQTKLSLCRENTDEEFHFFRISPMKRIKSGLRLRYRNKLENRKIGVLFHAANAEEIYWRSLMTPALDHIINYLENRFSSVHVEIVKLLWLIPSNFLPTNSSNSTALKELVDLYKKVSQRQTFFC